LSADNPSVEDLESQIKKLKEDNQLYKTRYEVALRANAPPPLKPIPRIEIDILPLAMFEGKTYLPQRLVDEVLVQTPKDYFITPISEKGGDVIFRYHEEKGIYLPDGIPWIETLVKRVFGEAVQPGTISPVIKLLQVSTYCFNPITFEEDKDHLIVENGALNIFTRELKPFSPEYRSLSQIPVKFDSEAECPRILKFMNEIAPDDIQFLQEWIGYHFLKDYRFQKALMLIGSGANGKTTFLKLIETFLGKENIAHESLYELSSNRFSSAELYGKLANIAPDLSSDELKRTGKFKALTGGDRVRAEKKHQNAFYYWNHAKLNFSCNQLPLTPDMSYAFFRRWVPLKLTRVFEGENVNPTILEEITTPQELSGFLNWTLDGLERLLKNGVFTDAPSAIEIQELWEEMQEPVQAFINRCIAKDPPGQVTKDDMWSAYNSFCRNFGHVTLSKNKLSVELKGKIPGLHDSRPTLKGKRMTVWDGINLFCGLLEENCQGCQGCQGSPFLDNLKIQKTLGARYNDLDNPDNPDQSLQNSIDEFLKFFDDIVKTIDDKILDYSKFEDQLVFEGWKRPDVKRVHDILVRDGMIFSPRPGFIKRCSP